MANYVHIENNNITEYHDKLPHNWRNVSGLNLLSKQELLALGWYWVENLPEHGDPETQYIAGYNYEILDDYVKQIPDIRTFTPEELEARKAQRKIDFMQDLRDERDRKLSICDWTQLGDVLEIHGDAWVTSWKVYRQSLRDIPEQYIDVDVDTNPTIQWPTPPQG
jgi:hypothetical protein